MEVNEYITRYRTARQSFYEWRNSTETIYKVMLAFSFACLTGASAFLRVYTPFSPVPFTAQVFVVLLSGAVLGATFGSLSQMMYVGLGIVGVPWFADGNFGFQYVLGATGGYLLGFIIASFVIGWVADRSVRARSLTGLVPLMVLGVLVIYAFGATWLALSLGVSPWKAIVLGVLPFIWLDIIKAFLAAGVGRVVTVRTQLSA